MNFMRNPLKLFQKKKVKIIIFCSFNDDNLRYRSHHCVDSHDSDDCGDIINGIMPL